MRQQAPYPLREEKALAENPEDTDQKVAWALQQIGLGHLLDRYALDHVLDWAQSLSLGEQQKLSFARVLIQKPRIVFLDEATSALDVASEEICYRKMEKAVSCFVSVGHRRSLQDFHTHSLMIRARKGGGPAECQVSLLRSRRHSTLSFGSSSSIVY